MYKWDWCHDSYRAPKMWRRIQTFEHGEDAEVRVTLMYLNLVYAVISYTGAGQNDYLQTRGTKESSVWSESRYIPLVCLHLPLRFFLHFPFLSPAGQSVQLASFVRVLIRMSDTYVWGTKKSRVGTEGGKDQCVMEGPPPFRRAPSRSSHGESRWMAGITLSATRLNRKLKNGRAAMKESRSCRGLSASFFPFCTSCYLASARTFLFPFND